MDIFVEQLIKRKQGGKDYLIYAGVFLAALVVLFLSMAFIPAFSFLVFVGICCGVYYLVTSRNLEFEYSVTNGDITIDKVINRSRRKRVVSLDVHDVEEIGKYRPQLLRSKQELKKFIVSEYSDGRDSWYFCAHTAKYGHVFVVLSPAARTLDATTPFLPTPAAVVAFGRN